MRMSWEKIVIGRGSRKLHVPVNLRMFSLCPKLKCSVFEQWSENWTGNQSIQSRLDIRPVHFSRHCLNTESVIKWQRTVQTNCLENKWQPHLNIGSQFVRYFNDSGIHMSGIRMFTVHGFLSVVSIYKIKRKNQCTNQRQLDHFWDKTKFTLKTNDLCADFFSSFCK